MCKEKKEFQLESIKIEIFRQAHVTIIKLKNQNQVAQKGPNQPVKNVSLGYSPIRTGVR